jgi:hypothetical protein
MLRIAAEYDVMALMLETVDRLDLDRLPLAPRGMIRFAGAQPCPTLSVTTDLPKNIEIRPRKNANRPNS